MHGGTRFTAPTRFDDDVVTQLRDLTDLAPLHQPKSLAGIDAVGAVLPDVPAVACFDTAFHATLPAAASTYALPLDWRQRWDVRRYGFHGLSHAYAARRAAEIVGARPASCGSSSAIWAPAHRCARSKPAARSTPRWVSHRSRGS